MPALRREQPADHARVREIHAAAFGRPDEADLVDVLRAQARPLVSLVAERAGRVVGHVLLTPVSIDPGPGPPAAGLAPVAVDPAHQGAGVGGALVRAGLEHSRETGWRAVFLVGDPAYYARFGFVLASGLGFRYGSPDFDAVLQVHPLGGDALHGLAGRVRFHPAFGQTDTDAAPAR